MRHLQSALYQVSPLNRVLPCVTHANSLGLGTAYKTLGGGKYHIAKSRGISSNHLSQAEAGQFVLLCLRSIPFFNITL